MEPNHSSSSPKPSSLRWQILRRALSSRSAANPGRLVRAHAPGSMCADSSLVEISRKTRNGFHLIPCHLVSEGGKDSDFTAKRDACFCYSLPLPNAPNLYLRQRLADYVAFHDFEVCNQHNIDNTGLVCQWPSEEVLAYYSLSHRARFRSKRVIELGSGYGLAGLVIAMTTEASEVVLSDGNPRVVDYVQSSIEANSASFGGTKVKSMVLHWDKHQVSDISGSFDVIVASDCTFFKEFHIGLSRTIRCLLKENSPSEAILFSPRRGDSLDKFLVEVKHGGLHFTITEIYDRGIWKQHEIFCNGDPSWANYKPDHCYPLLIRITQ